MPEAPAPVDVREETPCHAYPKINRT
jgi:hypothetical protein